MDHYDALGVSPNAANSALNNAFKKKTNAIRALPNSNITRRHTVLRNTSIARQTLKNSYNLLKNKGRRNEYNKTRKVVSSIQDYKIISQLINSKRILSPLQQVGDIIAKDLAIFSKNISDKLKKGYSPVGTPFSSSIYNICQVLVKDNSNLSEMIILPVMFDDKIDERIFPIINDNVLKKGFRPYETPISIKSTNHTTNITTVYNFQVFIK
jgi:hypothetical protein